MSAIVDQAAGHAGETEPEGAPVTARTRRDVR